MPDYIIPAVILIEGSIALVLSIFATQLGFDQDPGWGRARLAVLVIGIILSAFALSHYLYRRKTGKTHAILRSDTVKTGFIVAHVWGVIFIIYVWFVTYGNFTTWGKTTQYYAQLADAFSKGQLHVDQQPGRALLEAADPYDEATRPSFSDELWDLSLYKEKLFIYWGPLPALLLMPLQLIRGHAITDNYLTLFFFSALLVVNSLIIFGLRREFFPAVTIPGSLLSIAVIGLLLPITWSLSSPNIYTAAIGAGQFFLMAGLYMALLTLSRDHFPRGQYLFYTGLAWTCAVGSRAITGLSVLFLVAVILFWIAKGIPRPFAWKKYIRTVAPLLGPLLIGALAIGWYNWARFDSPLEFGQRYQISLYNMNRYTHLLFRLEYLPFNFYAYLLQPFDFYPRFPFIEPVWVSTLIRSLSIDTPFFYVAGRLTGLLFGAPFVVLSIAGLKAKDSFEGIKRTASPHLRLFIIFLSGSFAVNLIALLVYYFGQLRFMGDIISQLGLLAIIGSWSIVQAAPNKKSFASSLKVLLINLLLMFSLLAGCLLAITGEGDRMRRFNPGLFERIERSLSLP